MHPRGLRHVRRPLVLVLLAGCSLGPEHVDGLETGTDVTVCVGTSTEHAAGDTTNLEIRSQGDVIATAQFQVPGEVVLTIPSTAPDPRLLVDGREWASSPLGGGWGIATGDGCPSQR